ncbi:MAG: exonuclease SbcCD subunit D [Bacteroidales bacterium]|nr:exonuclease SbcCD subunit D [Bacteroidales bacterium]
MLKILHTSDWHLGHLLYDHDRSQEQADCMQQIVETTRREAPDAVVVSGDVFDRSTPSQTSRELFINTLIALRDVMEGRPVIVTAGNHDGKLMLDNDGRIFRLAGITVVGQVWRTEDGSVDLDRHIIAVGSPSSPQGYIVAVPHIYENSYPQMNDSPADGNRMTAFFQALLDRTQMLNKTQAPVVMSAHLFIGGSDIGGHEATRFGDRQVVGNCDSVSLPALGHGYDYLALGHIHRPQTLGSDAPAARYCGTPLPISFDEGGKHGLTMVSIAHHGATPAIRHIELHNPRPLLTLPEHPAPFAQAMAELIDFDADTDAYLRLNVLSDQPLPADYRTQINNIMHNKRARYCTLKLTAVGERDDEDITTAQHFSPDNMPSPLELARMHYKNRFGSEMPDDLLQLFEQAERGARSSDQDE